MTADGRCVAPLTPIFTIEHPLFTFRGLRLTVPTLLLRSPLTPVVPVPLPRELTGCTSVPPEPRVVALIDAFILILIRSGGYVPSLQAATRLRMKLATFLHFVFGTRITVPFGRAYLLFVTHVQTLYPLSPGITLYYIAGAFPLIPPPAPHLLKARIEPRSNGVVKAVRIMVLPRSVLSLPTHGKPALYPS